MYSSLSSASTMWYNGVGQETRVCVGLVSGEILNGTDGHRPRFSSQTVLFMGNRPSVRCVDANMLSILNGSVTSRVGRLGSLK